MGVVRAVLAAMAGSVRGSDSSGRAEPRVPCTKDGELVADRYGLQRELGVFLQLRKCAVIL